MPRAPFLEEPYRLFFPAGLAAGLIGVALWPLTIWGPLEFYPGPLHARLMLTGFIGAFVLGFMATAMPRMLGVRPLGGSVIGSIGFLWLASMAMHFWGSHWMGDLLFGLALLALVGSLALQFRVRTDIPPPGFVLAGSGLFLGITGAFALAVWESDLDLGSQAVWVGRYGRVALNEGFLLGAIGGVGSFFFPRLWGGATRQNFPEMRRPDPAWLRQAWIGLLAGLGLVLGCLLDAAGAVSLGAIIRLTAFGFFVIAEVASSLAARSESTLGRLVRIGLLAIPIGLILEAVVLPTQLIGVRHLVLIGGFNLILFAVATRTIFGHAGQRDRTTGRMNSMRWIGALILAAALTRISADLLPAVYQSHLNYAALVWLLAAGLWAGIVLWRVTIPDPDP